MIPTKRTLMANVARGVKLLDTLDPAWWNGGNGKGKPVIAGMVGHIDLDTLDLASGTARILGQRHKDAYGAGVAALGLNLTTAEDHGFNVWHRDCFGRPDYQDEKVASRLTELWIAVIQSRRFPRRKIASDPFVVRVNKTWVRSSSRKNAQIKTAAECGGELMTTATPTCAAQIDRDAAIAAITRESQIRIACAHSYAPDHIYIDHAMRATTVGATFCGKTLKRMSFESAETVTAFLRDRENCRSCRKVLRAEVNS